MRLLFLTCLFCLSWHDSAREIIVSEQGSQLPLCLDEHNPVPCQSLVAVSYYVTCHTVIRINGTHYTLQGVANFSGVENITITGDEHLPTHITCNVTGAGILFQGSLRIHLKHFSIANCGMSFLQKSRWYMYIGNMSAILIRNCSTVTLSNLTVSRNCGQGVSLVNTVGSVEVISSVFEHNLVSSMSDLGGGGGLRVVMQHDDNRPINLLVAECNFTNNTARDSRRQHYSSPPYFARGGGISIEFFKSCHCNKVELRNVIASGNTAIFGGGLYAYCGTGTSKNNISVHDSLFTMNTASELAGGGANVGFTTDTVKNSIAPWRNYIEFSRTNFTDNIGLYGGGMSVFIASVLSFNENDKNEIVIRDCQFHRNQATGGTALDISPDTLKSYGQQFVGNVTVENCNFTNNTVESATQQYSTIGNVNNGAVYISKIYVAFCKDVWFVGNTNTALYVTSATLDISNGSRLHFLDNVGDCGGAIHLGGSSIMIVQTTASFYFNNNTASYGGAICAMLEELHGFIYTEVCFISILSENEQIDNVSFHFTNNSAYSSFGKDVFVSSLQPCKGFCNFKMKAKLNITDLFTNSCIGNYFFNNQPLISTNTANRIATYPTEFMINDSNQLLKVIPGMLTGFKFHLLDELGNDVKKVFPPTAKLKPINSFMSVHQSYKVITNDEIIIRGISNTSGQLVLECSGVKTSIMIEMMQCPPGYITEGMDEMSQCVCGKNNYTEVDCISHKPELKIGYWAGYIGACASEHTFFTGICAAELCNSSSVNGRLQLAENATQLAKTMCAPNRTGILCGKCDKDMVVFYHSASFTCGSNSSCQYGIPLYIVSELLPVTIIFLVILLFNISLTSGALYSFVFYAQTLSALNTTAFGIVIVKGHLAMQALQFVYGFFNLEVLNKECISFCVVPTKSIMVLYMFKYATLLYAFFLVLATILVLRLHSCYSCVKLCRRCGRRNIRGSIVDGLSAFLVLCYFQCAQVTYRILVPSVVQGIDGIGQHNRPLFDGELRYFKGDHLYYAAPAIVCLVVILIPLPTVLLLEPLLTKIFSMDCFTRTEIKWLYNRLRLKLMPFLDSFQACFKDKHRYVAGLYFLYRLIAPIGALSTVNIYTCYTVACILLFIILLYHTIIRPYKIKWHSLIEFTILINLLMVTILTMFNYKATLWEGKEGKEQIRSRIFLQDLLLCFPIGYLICYTGGIIIIRCCYPFKWCKKQVSSDARSSEMNETLRNEFPARLLEESSDYNTF